MASLLQKALDEIAKLPVKDQERIAAWLIVKLAEEKRQASPRGLSPEALERLEIQALEDAARFYGSRPN